MGDMWPIALPPTIAAIFLAPLLAPAMFGSASAIAAAIFAAELRGLLSDELSNGGGDEHSSTATALLWGSALAVFSVHITIVICRYYPTAECVACPGMVWYVPCVCDVCCVVCAQSVCRVLCVVYVVVCGVCGVCGVLCVV